MYEIEDNIEIIGKSIDVGVAIVLAILFIGVFYILVKKQDPGREIKIIRVPLFLEGSSLGFLLKRYIGRLEKAQHPTRVLVSISVLWAVGVILYYVMFCHGYRCKYMYKTILFPVSIAWVGWWLYYTIISPAKECDSGLEDNKEYHQESGVHSENSLDSVEIKEFILKKTSEFNASEFFSTSTSKDGDVGMGHFLLSMTLIMGFVRFTVMGDKEGCLWSYFYDIDCWQSWFGEMIGSNIIGLSLSAIILFLIFLIFRNVPNKKAFLQVFLSVSLLEFLLIVFGKNLR